MISSPRFGNIHVLEPLVYGRFQEMLSENRKNAYASPTTEPTNPAMNFLADVTGEEDVRDGFNNKLWQCYNLPEGKAMLLTDMNGGHYTAYKLFRDGKTDENPKVNLMDVAQAYLDSLPKSQKVNRLKDETTPGLSRTGISPLILGEPVYRSAYKRFKSLPLPGEIAEYWALHAFQRFELMERYMPRLAKVFDFQKDSDRQDDFVNAVSQTIERLFGDRFLKLLSKHFASPFKGKIVEGLAYEGFPVKDVSRYDDVAGFGNSESDRRWAMEEDLMGFAKQLIETDHPGGFTERTPSDTDEDSF
jgi:hypothetical protein